MRKKFTVPFLNSRMDLFLKYVIPKMRAYPKIRRHGEEVSKMFYQIFWTPLPLVQLMIVEFPGRTLPTSPPPTDRTALWGLSGGSESKESACNAGDPGSVPGLGRSTKEGNGNQFQYSCLENSKGKGAWWATGHGVAKSRTQLSD